MPENSCSSEQFKPDDHSELVPLLPIPNRTVKRVSADDSADPRVKVGHRQAIYSEKHPVKWRGVFLFGRLHYVRCYTPDISRIHSASRV